MTSWLNASTIAIIILFVIIVGLIVYVYRKNVLYESTMSDMDKSLKLLTAQFANAPTEIFAKNMTKKVKALIERNETLETTVSDLTRRLEEMENYIIYISTKSVEKDPTSKQYKPKKRRISFSPKKSILKKTPKEEVESESDSESSSDDEAETLASRARRR